MKHARHCRLCHLGKIKLNDRHKLHALFLSISLLLVTAVTVGGTLAYLVTKTEPVDNIFRPSNVSCQVTERFTGTIKSNVNVINTGNTDAYIRVKLVSYRVNEAGQHIGGNADIPGFILGTGWVKNGEFFYYTKPVKPGERPTYDLLDSIELIGNYTDADGGKQVIEVMAEAVQAKGIAEDGAKAVVKAWGLDPETLVQGGAGK